MKKSILTAAFLLMGCMASFAQFEESKMYIGASFDGLQLSYSESTKTALSLGANLGYMFAKDCMLIGEVGFSYRNSAWQEAHLGLKGRYYIEQNGLFLQLGARYIHEYKSYNDFQIMPEVGYCFFLNHHLSFEPSVYYGISLSDFSDKSEFGLRIGLGWYF